jgi:hypothetical protein
MLNLFALFQPVTAPTPAPEPEVVEVPVPVVAPAGPSLTVNAYLRLLELKGQALTRARARIVAALRTESPVPGKAFAVADAVAWPLAEIEAAHKRITVSQPGGTAR